MRIAPILAAALFCGVSCLPSDAPAQQPPAVPGRKATLRIAWWRAPENPPELVLMQDKDRVSFSPDVMALSVKTQYFGPPTAIIAKKTFGTEKDKQGNPVVIWAPFAAVPVPTDGADLAVILFPDQTGQAAQVQVFDFSEEAFPYGTIQIVNYTNARVDAAIDKTPLQVPSRGQARYPGRFTKRQPATFSLAVTEPGSEPRLITSTTMIFFPNTRLMYFVLEMPGAKPEERYHNSVIMENKVVAPILKTPPLPPPPEPSEGKAKGIGKAKADAGGAN